MMKEEREGGKGGRSLRDAYSNVEQGREYTV